MKKLYALLLAIAMMASLAACGGSDTETESASASTEVETEVDTEVEEEEEYEEEEYEEEAEAEEETSDTDTVDFATLTVATALVSAQWVDDEGAYYAFYEDGTMETVAPDGSMQLTGAYMVGNDGTEVYLVMEFADAGLLMEYYFTDLVDGDSATLYLADASTGEEMSMSSLTGDVAAGAEVEADAGLSDLDTTTLAMIAALPAMTWVDDDGSYYAFYEDGSMETASADGSMQLAGAYGVGNDGSNLYLTIELPDVGLVLEYVLTGIEETDTAVAFYLQDLSTGADTYLASIS